MGLYTEHWEQYKQKSARGTLRALAVAGVGILAIAGAGYLLSPLNDARTGVLLCLGVVWLATLTVVVVRASKVACPRCSTRYSRGKYLVNCPECGLRMLQEDP